MSRSRIRLGDVGIALVLLAYAQYANPALLIARVPGPAGPCRVSGEIIRFGIPVGAARISLRCPGFSEPVTVTHLATYSLFRTYLNWEVRHGVVTVVVVGYGPYSAAPFVAEFEYPTRFPATAIARGGWR